MLGRVGQGLPRPKSSKNLQAAEIKVYPTTADAYELLEQCGSGMSATVWKALCKPFNEIVAVKLLDLESNAAHLEEITREAATMKLLSHPNVLSLHCAFMHEQHLWMVEPYASEGSVLNIMKFKHPQGLSEGVIATIVKEVLKGLEYVHKCGDIHRDVKAGNILIDKDGSVKLADFGVAATMERGSTYGGGRNTFVGTPCWMAPEVMENEDGRGYNHLADIWSLGITILELAYGDAPFARFPPLKVLMMTLQGPPPALEDSHGKHFTKAMRDCVSWCLQKNPNRRPSARDLLEHRFIRHSAHDVSWLQRNLLASLPPLPERVKLLKARKGAGKSQENDADMLQSQIEYAKGVSSWDFDVSALKLQAMLEDGVLCSTSDAAAAAAEAPGEHAGWDFGEDAGGGGGAALAAPHSPRAAAADASGSRTSSCVEVPAAADAGTGLQRPAGAADADAGSVSRTEAAEAADASSRGPTRPKPTVVLPTEGSLSTAGSLSEAPFSAGQLLSSGASSPVAVPGSTRAVLRSNARSSKHGRFTLWETSAEELPASSSQNELLADELPPQSSSTRASDGAALTPSGRKEPGLASGGKDDPRDLAGSSVDKDGKAEKADRKGKDKEQAAKRRGRFNILEEGHDGRMPRVVSNPVLGVGEREASGLLPSPAVDTLLPRLDELVAAARAQQAGLQALHHAISESSRGNPAELLQILKKPLLPVADAEEMQRLELRLAESEAEVKRLGKEVAQLRERSDELEAQLRR